MTEATEHQSIPASFSHTWDQGWWDQLHLDVPRGVKRPAKHPAGDRNQDHPQEKEMQKRKMAVLRGLTNSCEKKGSEKQRRKGKIYLFECRVPKNSKERQDSLLQRSVQRNGGTIEWERLEISSRKLEIPREHFMQRWLNKGQKWYGPNRSRRY